MRVLHVITNFSEKGGAERMLARLIEESPQIEHHLISLIHTSELYGDALRRCASHSALNWSLKSTPIVLLRLIRYVWLIKPDVIQCWMYHANVFGALAALFSGARKRLIWGVRHSLEAYEEESFSTKTALKLGRFLVGIPRASIYCSYAALQQHRKIGYSTCSDIYIPNGVDLGLYGCHSSAGIVKSVPRFTVGAVGRFHEAKGYAYLLASIALVQLKTKDVRFVLAGRGVSSSNPVFMDLVAKYDIDLNGVDLCGDVSDMASFYQKIDVLVQSSITEGFPNVLVEAMASCVPCIATDVGDSRKIIGNSGFIVPARSPEALAGAIFDFMNLHDDERKRYQRLACARVRDKYNISVVASKYLDLWGHIGSGA